MGTAGDLRLITAGLRQIVEMNCNVSLTLTPLPKPSSALHKAESIMLSQTFHYSIASVVSAAIGLLSAVVFTRLLSPEEYGVYVVGLSTAGIVSALLFTWVRVSALRFQSEGGAVDVRKTIFVAYLISALAAPSHSLLPR